MISWVIGQMAAGRSPAEIVCRLPILPGRPTSRSRSGHPMRQRLGWARQPTPEKIHAETKFFASFRLVAKSRVSLFPLLAG